MPLAKRRHKTNYYCKQSLSSITDMADKETGPGRPVGGDYTMSVDRIQGAQRARRRQLMLGGAIMASALSGMFSAPASAQEQDPQPEASEAVRAQDNTIMVTARRREESLQETPIAISV